MAKTAQDFIEQYLTTLAVERRLSENTLKAYRRDLNKLLEFCNDKGILLWQGLSNHHVRMFSASLNANKMHAKKYSTDIIRGSWFQPILNPTA